MILHHQMYGLMNSFSIAIVSLDIPFFLIFTNQSSQVTTF